MFKKLFLACLMLWLPLAVLAKEHPVSETDLAAYKELAQTKLDAAKESLQKDMQAQDKRIEREDKLLDSFSTRITDLSAQSSHLSYVLTLLGLAAGLLGYFTVSSKAKSEARSAAEEWVEKKGKEILEEKLREFDLHIANAKQSVTERAQKFENELGELRDAAAPQLEELQRRLSAHELQASSTTAQAAHVHGDAIGKLVEALRRKPEAEYNLADWNVRAHDAYNKGNFSLAAEYWLQAAHAGGARGVEIAQALYNAGVALGQLNRNEEAIAAYDEVVRRYGDAPEPALREQVAKALLNKGFRLNQLNRAEESIAVYDEVVKRYGDAPEPVLREQVANALFNKGFRLDQLNRAEESIAVYDEVVKRYGDAPEPALREQVANALVNKGVGFGRLNYSEEAIAVYDEVVKRYGDAPEPALRERVAKARGGKGFRLLCRAKAKWADETQRLRDLKESSALSAQAVEDSNEKPIPRGNQAYAAFLLGQPEAARALLHQALQGGGEVLYKATLGDIEIHPVPPDVEFRALLEEVWAEVKPKA